MRPAYLAAALLSLAGPASVQEMPAPKPSARDLYVACYLYLRDEAVISKSAGYHPMGCAAAALSGMVYREGQSQPSKYKFCLPSDAAVEADIPKAMAAAYLDGFDELPPAARRGDGAAAFVVVLMRKWPCPAP